MNRTLARRLGAIAGVAVTMPFLATAANASTQNTKAQTPIIVDDSSITPSTIEFGGATVLPTTRTVAHWHGTALNPTDGVTYGFNMVGADPSLATTTTISVADRLMISDDLSQLRNAGWRRMSEKIEKCQWLGQ